MTVAEKIQHLKTLPSDARLFVMGYEKGIDDLNEVKPVAVVPGQSSEWYYGAHRVVDGADKSDCAGFLLRNSDDTRHIDGQVWTDRCFSSPRPMLPCRT